MPRLGALDAAFLQLEDGHVALHIGATAIFAGPAPSEDEVRTRYERVSVRSPWYRRRLHRVAFDLRRPRWVDCTEIDLDHHVRRTALPAPGSPEQLERLVGDIMSKRLDPDRPLWQAWIVDGLANDRWALITKVHHSVVDGLAGMSLFEDLLDPSNPPRYDTAPTARPFMQLIRAATRPDRAVAALARATAGLLGYARYLYPGPQTSLVGTLGATRGYRMVSFDLAELRFVRERFGGTVNDVVLAAVTRAFRALLLFRGVAPEAGTVRCLVPVALRSVSQAHAGANKISALLVELPVEVPDPLDAYAVLHGRTEELKRSGEGAAGAGGVVMAEMLPTPIVAGVLTALRHLPQRVVTTIVTNVPGPRGRQSLLDRPMLAFYPYVPLGARMRTGVAASAYADQVHLGITCDRSSVPDIDVFTRALADAVAEFAKHAIEVG